MQMFFGNEEILIISFRFYFNVRFAGDCRTAEGGILKRCLAEKAVQEAIHLLRRKPASLIMAFTEGLFAKSVSVDVSGQSSAGQRDGSLHYQPLPGGSAASE